MDYPGGCVTAGNSSVAFRRKVRTGDTDLGVNILFVLMKLWGSMYGMSRKSVDQEEKRSRLEIFPC